MITTFQYRLYPTVKQEKIFEEQLDACRQIYNQALAMRKEAYEEKSVGFACTFLAVSFSPVCLQHRQAFSRLQKNW